MRILSFMFLAALAATAGACGPNKLSARGAVLHPMHKFRAVEDAELGRPKRKLVIVRKEPRLVVAHTIVGAYVKPRGLGWLEEPAEIIPQDTDGSGLFIEAAICSDHKDEIVDLGSFDYALALEDGRKVKGSVHRKWPLQNFTQKISGMHMAPHLVTRNRQTGEVHVYRHVEEVDNEIELYCGKVRILFQADRLIAPATKHVTFIMTGYDRRRSYRFDFTYDVNEAMRTSNTYEK